MVQPLFLTQCVLTVLGADCKIAFKVNGYTLGERNSAFFIFAFLLNIDQPLNRAPDKRGY